MKVLLTGASGRIGAKLIESLQAAGHFVRGFDIIEPRPGQQPDEYIRGSLLDSEACEQALDGMEAVLHLAAFMSWNPAHNRQLFDINVQGTYTLLQACAGRPLQRFVFASSGEVYPELSPVYLPIDEAHPTQPTSPYGLSKLLGEEMVRQQGRAGGLPFCILRFSHTQSADELLDPASFFSGPRFYVNAKISQLRALPASEAVIRTLATLEAVAGPTEQHYIGCDLQGQPYRMGLCDVGDMAQGIGLALVHREAVGESFNIGAAESFNFDEAVPWLARKTGLNVLTLRLHTTPYRYDTSIAKAQRMLGYAPQHSIFSMIDSQPEWA